MCISWVNIFASDTFIESHKHQPEDKNSAGGLAFLFDVVTPSQDLQSCHFQYTTKAEANADGHSAEANASSRSSIARLMHTDVAIFLYTSVDIELTQPNAALHQVGGQLTARIIGVNQSAHLNVSWHEFSESWRVLGYSIDENGVGHIIGPDYISSGRPAGETITASYDLFIQTGANEPFSITCGINDYGSWIYGGQESRHEEGQTIDAVNDTNTGTISIQIDDVQPLIEA